MEKQPLINIERKFRLEIEGLRFVAALLVAIYHIWFNRVSGGVDVFFVISGFLITSSIISTINRTGELKFLPYIKKLMKRLLPSVFFILSIVLVLSYFLLPKSIFGKTLKEVLASMFFYQNWQLAISNTDYLDASQMKTPIEHFWALSIQGQFYLIWFLLFTIILILVKKYRNLNVKRVINTLLGIILVTSLAYSIYLTSTNQQWAYFTTFTRVWQFALGSLLCINLSSIRVNKVFAVLAGWIGLIALISTGIIFDVSEKFPGYIALWPMIAAILIVLSGTRETRFGVKRFLGSKWMVKIGGISFGIYLWHWVLLSFYRYNVQDIPGFFMGTFIILVSIVLSFFMTQLIEDPIRTSNNDKFAFKRLGIMGSINLTLIIALFIGLTIDQKQLNQKVADADYPGVMAVHDSIDVPEKEAIPDLSQVFDDLPQAHKDGSNQNLKESDLKVGEYGETENYDATIALIGSSHSEHWQGALLEAIKDQNIRLLNITRSGTRFSIGYQEDDLKGIWNQHVLNYLKETDVDLVVAQSTASDTDKLKIQHQMMDQLKYVKNEYDIDVLALRDVPRYSFNILESLETDGTESTIEKMNNENNQKDTEAWEEFINSDSSMYKLDLTEYLILDEKFQPIIGNIVVYRDNRHLTNTISKSFGPILEEEVLKILKENQ
ncbi:MAG TPA: acyltransferase family protein [Pseudogracilibacillus sp.]|nr:acyltransferase family protein [Pseudogracilibacillus sp.]